jgi:hypothetical protein
LGCLLGQRTPKESPQVKSDTGAAPPKSKAGWPHPLEKRAFASDNK